MSDQPEHDRAAADQANAAADAAAPAPVHRSAADPDQHRPPDASRDQTEKPIAEQESRAGEATAADETAGGPVNAATTVAAADLPSAPDLPVVAAGSGVRPRSKTQKAARRAGKSRPAKHRQSRSRASGWILFGLCGVPALLAVVLLANQLHWLPGSRPATPHDERRTTGTENAAQVPPLPKFKPGEFSRTDVQPTEVKPAASSRGGVRPAESTRAESSPNGARPKQVKPAEFSRTGVRPMDADELARRRRQIDNFAEMGRAEEEKLHREQPQTDAPQDPE